RDPVADACAAPLLPGPGTGMSGFLRHLVGRAQGLGERLERRRPALFESRATPSAQAVDAGMDLEAPLAGVRAPTRPTSLDTAPAPRTKGVPTLPSPASLQTAPALAAARISPTVPGPPQAPSSLPGNATRASTLTA